MDMMKVLFDQDEVTRSLLASKYKEGREEGGCDNNWLFSWF